MRKLVIDERYETVRLDHYMTDVLGDYSRSQVQRFIEDGSILVNQEVAKANYRLKEDDVINVDISEEDFVLKPIEMDLEVIYEDDYLLIVNKEAGLIVHPSESSKDQETLVNGLLAYTSQLSDLGGELRPGIVHRLDKDTSGLLVVAKTNEAHEKLVEMLKQRDIVREYIAIVHHKFNHQQALVDAPIGRDPHDRKKMTVTHVNSKDAKTYLTLVEEFKDYSILKAKLDSGRTHQIRVHCQYIKHPVVGDEMYGYRNTLEMQGHALHSYHLAFNHPITNEKLDFEIDLPMRMKGILEEIRRQD
ncbi:RluA family pseudouridine synthase [Erysipelothrix urinaevulpis]|uniref:RluA family pseudouridine synthase n=1 Tax=Erysipelothrix urinaevulpis TaxID=2683717 RepID=UPI001359EC2A|nr:RluA family pseudouridine synthase [Erysipelothrix urinaevulpis]